MTGPPTGLTKDVGWQIGVSRTVPVNLETVWTFLLSPEGLALWLGEGVQTPLTKGDHYETDEGTTGEIRSLHRHDRVRLTWQPHDRSDSATVQIALRPATTGCTLRFHTERLYDSDERERMRGRWKRVADSIQSALTGHS